VTRIAIASLTMIVSSSRYQIGVVPEGHCVLFRVPIGATSLKNNKAPGKGAGAFGSTANNNIPMIIPWVLSLLFLM
jgi:hypothetical protein